MIQLLPLRTAHMADVLRIQQACYREIVPESHASMHAKIVAAPDTCFVAQGAAGVIAYIIAVPVRYPQLPALDAPGFAVPAQADTLYLHDLAVSATARGTGAGQALVRRALAVGRARGLAGACLVAIQGSAGYWRQFGFEAVVPDDAAVAAKLASYGAGAQLMRATS